MVSRTLITLVISVNRVAVMDPAVQNTLCSGPIARSDRMVDAAHLSATVTMLKTLTISVVAELEEVSIVYRLVVDTGPGPLSAPLAPKLADVTKAIS